jgi:hypothetical protein
MFVPDQGKRILNVHLQTESSGCFQRERERERSSKYSTFFALHAKNVLGVKVRNIIIEPFFQVHCNSLAV